MSALNATAYLLMACGGYLIYAVGFITPFLRADLGVAPWVAALPNSAMAVGLVGASALATRLAARVGPRRTIRGWAALMAVAATLLAIPVTILPVLAGALLFGASIGGMLVHVNSALGEGRGGATLLVRANLWSVAGALVGPLLLSWAASGPGWPLGLLVPLPVLVLLVFLLPPSPARDLPPSPDAPGPRLPGAYWLAWLFLALSIGAEFSFVVWAAQVVASRTGISDVAATGLASLYVAGMVGGRLALATGFGTEARRLPLLRLSTSAALAGAILVALTTDPRIAGLGLLLGGLGISPAYPLGASLAIALAPGTPLHASRRLAAASGVAIFTAPLVLGVGVGLVGLAGAWVLVLGILLLGLGVLFRVSDAVPEGVARASA